MSQQRKGGIIFVKVNSTQYSAKGNFTYNLGKPKREAIIGMDGVHGYKETPQVAFVEGEFTDDVGISLETLVTMTEATVTLELANGKVISLRDAWYAGDGNAQSEEGNITVRFEGKSGEEI